MRMCDIKIGNNMHSASTSQWIFELSIRQTEKKKTSLGV